MPDNIFDPPTETDLDGGAGAFEPNYDDPYAQAQAPDPSAMFRRRPGAVGGSVGRGVGSGVGRGVGSGVGGGGGRRGRPSSDMTQPSVMNEVAREQAKVKTPVLSFEAASADAQASSADASSNPDYEDKNMDWARRNFYNVVKPMFDNYGRNLHAAIKPTSHTARGPHGVPARSPAGTHAQARLPGRQGLRRTAARARGSSRLVGVRSADDGHEGGGRPRGVRRRRP